MQRIGREEHTRQTKLRDEVRHGRNLLRGALHLLVRQDQRGVAGKRTQDMNGSLIVQVVETAPQRFAVQRDRQPAIPAGLLVKLTRVAAKGRLEIRRVEGEEEITQGVHGRSTPEPRAEDGVQALPVHAHEGDDALIRGRPGQHGQDREQEQMGQRVAPALWAARILDLVKSGEQGSKRHHGGLHEVDAASTDPSRNRALIPLKHAQH